MFSFLGCRGGSGWSAGRQGLQARDRGGDVCGPGPAFGELRPQDGSVCPIWAGRWWKLDLKADDTVSVNWSYSSPASGFYQFLVFSPSTTDEDVLDQASQGNQVQFDNSDSSPASDSLTVSSTGTYPFIIGDGCPSTSGPFTFTVDIQQ
ncbi:MAG TPA: hypothetical protein VFB06_09115 [Streptosporangiaceae bacterium]|nr:hypothetical protein [Streptosporangiaceae bacterium]